MSEPRPALLLIELEMKLREADPDEVTATWLRERAADVWQIRTAVEGR